MTPVRNDRSLKALFCGLILFFLHLSQIRANGIDSIRVTVTEGTNMATDLSPDKKQIAIDLQGTIWVLPATGGVAKPITDNLGDCRQPSWSPDGKTIAFHAFWDGRYHIWTVPATGGKPTKLTDGLQDDREPHWSPDGKHLVFSSDRSGNYDIWQLTLADSKLTQLTKDSGNDFNPAFSPDGKQVVFASDRTNAPGVYVVTLAGNSEKNVSPSNAKIAAPSWQPDGSHIYYNVLTNSKSGLEIVSLTDGKTQMLTEATDDVFPFRTSWLSSTDYLFTSSGLLKRGKIGSSTFQTIPFQAIITLPRTSYKRKTYDFDSKKPQPVRGIKGSAISPDGKQIAFAALGDIWLLTKGTKSPERITQGPTMELEPGWSPDGTKLTYVSDRNGNMDVWIRDLKTGQDRLLVDMADDLHYPTWSPDGSKIAFYQSDPRNAWGRSTLYTADVTYTADLTAPKTQKLHESVFVPSQASWSADGKTIAISALHPYSSRYREGVSEVLLLSLDGKNDRYVTPAPGHSLATRGQNGPIWSPDGTKMAYILDGLLWITDVKPDGTITGTPRQLTSEQSDTPTWTGDSKSLLFLATDVLKQVYLADGRIETLPMDLTWTASQPAGPTIIHAGRLFDGKANTYHKNVDIILEGHRIKAIEPHKAGRSGKLIDASGKTVIPGLFEMHTHQHSMVGEKIGRLWLSFGITSVREPGADPYDALERKESWASSTRPGPRQFFTGGLTDGNRIYYGAATSINSDEQLDRELNRAIRLGYDLIKTYVRMPDARQQRITTFAHANGIPVSSHEIFPAMRYDVDAVEHIGGTSRRGYSPKITATNHSYQDVIQLLAKSGMNITPTASLQGGFSVLGSKDPSLYENRQYKAFYSEEYSNALQASSAQFAKISPGYLTNFGNLQKGVKALIDAGAHVTTGTDSPFVPYGLSLHTELQSFVGAGLTPYQALRSATLWAAETVGVSKDLGSIEPGKLADMVIVNGDPLTNIKDALNVEQVIKNGEVMSIDQLLTRP